MAESDFLWSRYSHTQERVFRPHIRHTEPVLTECDLDWKSRLRWIPEPRYSDAPFPQIKDIKFPDQIKLIRSFPQDNMVSRSEWTFYPNFGQPVTYHVGKRCFIDKIHHGAKRCTSEHTLESTIGKKKLGIPLSLKQMQLFPSSPCQRSSGEEIIMDKRSTHHIASLFKQLKRILPPPECVPALHPVFHPVDSELDKLFQIVNE